MNEYTFSQIIDEVYRREYEEFDSAPEHRFSLRHRFRMKRILRLFRKNEKRMNMPRFWLTRRTVQAMLIIIILAALTACTATLIIGEFIGKKYEDNTRLFSLNIEGAPTTIENIYEPAGILDKYARTTVQQTKSKYHVIFTADTGETITFRQSTKETFDTHFNTEGCDFENVDVSGSTALYINYGSNDIESGLVVWDNGDYIFLIDADLSKNDLLNLAKSTEIK